MVTNPLHYTYLRQIHDVPAIGSSQNVLLRDYASELHFSKNIELFAVKNSLDSLMTAHQSQGHESMSYCTWKAVDVPYDFLGNPYSLAHMLEQKAAIRSVLPAELFPPFKIVENPQVAMLEYEALSRELVANALVLQIDFSTGGKGTYFVQDQSELDAIKPALLEAGQTIVVSKRIDGVARALQCLITDGSVKRMDWWHQDLVGIAGVCNLSVPTASRYCGAVLQNIPENLLDQINTLTTLVGERLIAAGYAGVFGVDIVVEEATDKVFLIEINPRFTAVSHVYATAMHALGCGADFLTTAVLDSLSNTVPIRQEATSVSPRLPHDYYYLKLQNVSSEDVLLTEACRLGVYDNGVYKRFGFGIENIQGPEEAVVIPEGNPAAPYSPGMRVFDVIGIGNPVQAGQLTSEATARIAALQDSFVR